MYTRLKKQNNSYLIDPIKDYPELDLIQRYGKGDLILTNQYGMADLYTITIYVLDNDYYAKTKEIEKVRKFFLTS